MAQAKRKTVSVSELVDIIGQQEEFEDEEGENDQFEDLPTTFNGENKMKQRRGTGFVFDQQKDDLEKQRKDLEKKFNEISEKTEKIVFEEEDESEKSENDNKLDDKKEISCEQTKSDQEIAKTPKVQDDKK